MTFSGELRLEEPQLRIAEGDAGAALGAIVGKPVVVARTRLRFGPGRTCESLARLLDRAISQAESRGLDPALLVVADGTARAAEDIVRVRRKAYGIADWIHTPTSRVAIVLRPAALYEGDDTRSPELCEPPVLPDNSADASAEPADERAAAVREALMEVIDPDLGVNIVDLGLVRTVVFEGQTPIITMTLTSPACPLTAVIESQIHSSIATLVCVDGFRVDWQWIPAWRPSDITDSGREQLHAIGFTI
jgi:metal-sulfur cluster biosynthetic enzyme